MSARTLIRASLTGAVLLLSAVALASDPTGPLTYQSASGNNFAPPNNIINGVTALITPAGGSGGGGMPQNITTDAGVNITTDSGVQITTD